MGTVDAEITDKRLLRGSRTRRTVLRRAVDIASLDSLEGLSFGRLAADTGLSKAGIQTLFRSKEALQLATIEYFREVFIDAVVRPANPKPPGAQRLRALVDNWLAYVSDPLLEGGCFQSANLADFDSRPGPVRDALIVNQARWTGRLADELAYARAHGEIADLDPELAAFQIDAVLKATNTALRLGDSSAVAKARRIVESLLVSA
ncbi:TetR/AcrR family transcriptional regulator [Nocardia yunnanensis]|uniref:TetR/AcrR family transcriptional regulator n=1 Tax=Nocardia yunnanensis TaxID=2382165 RepID=A0A386ZFE9_9NOCA|nr:TetR/AcrR family transcriptional regulator [Nocardia yunnanensis]AYF75943.1 TetR/AcrR family transcriptional regulator [Nocardia yunnanensis]